MSETAESTLPVVTNRRKVLGLITFGSAVFFLVMGIGVYGQDPHIPLILGAVVGIILGKIDGWKYEEMENGMVSALTLAMSAMLILLVIGILIGTWLMGGVVQSLVYYGLALIDPKFFLVSALLICSVVSISTGTSWATAGTMGVVLIAIASALNVPLAMAAGAIVSGAYFGDKMSPLSDTTNLAAAVSGANLFDHIKSMMWTTVPVYILCMILYTIMGFVAIDATGADMSNITKVQDTLAASAQISPLTLLAPAMVFVIVAFKIPALPGLFAAALLGIPCAIFLQGITDPAMITEVMLDGYAFDGSTFQHGAETVQEFYNEYDILDGGNFYPGMEFFTHMPTSAETIADVYNPEAIAKLPFEPAYLLDTRELLTRGGLMSMMWTIALIMCAMVFGGVIESTGFLASIVSFLQPLTKKAWSLSIVSIVSGAIINATAADQYVAVILPGRMFRENFIALNLAPRYQSRIIENGGALSSALIPWNTCGATMSGFLGVNSFAYAPYAFFNWVSPVVEVISAAVGYKVFKRDEDIKLGLIKED